MTSAPIILDANLALLFTVGLTDPAYIAKHKRLASYDTIDFDHLCRIVETSSGLVFTPNVLTETSNLVRYVADPIRSRISLVLAELVRRTEEQFVPSLRAVDRLEHVRLGITDSALLDLATSGAVLLTVDLDLYLAALRAELLVINYNHVRERRPDYR